MLVKDLITNWNGAFDEQEKAELINDINIRKYIPFSEKTTAINALMDTTVFEVDGLNTYDSMDRWFNFIMAAIMTYTDLELSDIVEDLYKEMDFLIGNGIWTAISESAGTDLEDFLAFFNQRIEDKMRGNSIEYAFGKILYKINENLTAISKEMNLDSLSTINTALTDITQFTKKDSDKNGNSSTN